MHHSIIGVLYYNISKCYDRTFRISLLKNQKSSDKFLFHAFHLPDVDRLKHQENNDGNHDEDQKEAEEGGAHQHFGTWTDDSFFFQAVLD